MLVNGSCEWDVGAAISWFLSKLISVKNYSFYWFIKSSLCTFNVSVKLLLKSSKSLIMLLVFWALTLGIELYLGMERHVQLEIILHFMEWLVFNNSNKIFHCYGFLYGFFDQGNLKIVFNYKVKTFVEHLLYRIFKMYIALIHTVYSIFQMCRVLI